MDDYREFAYPANAPLYQTDQAVRQCETTVKQHLALSDLSEVDQGLFAKAENATHVLITDKNIFHPQGGGQPSDKGVVSAEDGDPAFEVSLARYSISSPSAIFHAGHYVGDSPTAKHFQAGHPVKLEIDSAARDLHSRIHTAGHIISFAVHSLRDQIGRVGEGKASHYPDAAYVEFIGPIASEHKAAIQAKVDEYIRKDLEIQIRFLNEEDARKQSTDVPEVIKSDSEGWVRVMIVEGVGGFPCGGTHLPSTKDVKGVEVRNIRRKKNITKISYSVS